jgi:hypothetical protein
VRRKTFFEDHSLDRGIISKGNMATRVMCTDLADQPKSSVMPQVTAVGKIHQRR